MGTFNLEKAIYKELQAKAAELGLKSVGVSKKDLKKTIVEKLKEVVMSPADKPEFDREKTIKFLKDHNVALTGKETDEEFQELMKGGPKKEDDTEEDKEELNNEEDKDTEYDGPDTAEETSKVPEPVEKVYQSKTVIGVNNRILNGKTYKDVTVATGETYTLSKEDFERDVKPRG